MNTHHIILAITMKATLVCGLVSAAEGDRHFLRSVGTLSVSDAQVRTLITASKSTNAHPAISVAWRAGDVTDSASKPMTQTGWFVFVERPRRVWVFDGNVLSLLERGDKTVSDSSSPEVFKTCPKQVRDALPERIRKGYFP